MFEKIVAHTAELVHQEALKHGIVELPRVVLGLSGGADSVLLFHVLKNLRDQNKIIFFAAHLDHGWREESVVDEEFCKQLCEKHSVTYVSEHAKNLPLTVKFNGSREEVARKMRRYFFEQTKQKFNADFVLLAHHQQDQQETFFMRLLRGSSLAGLACMELADGFYLRPLLFVSKQEILKYLQINSLTYVHDKTNDLSDYLRNRIRKSVLPAFKQCDERFDHKFASTLKHLKTENQFLEELTQEAFDVVFTCTDVTQPEGIRYGNRMRFIGLKKPLKRRVIISWLIQEKVPFAVSEGLLNEIEVFLESPRGGRHELSPYWGVVKKRQQFWIQKN